MLFFFYLFWHGESGEHVLYHLSFFVWEDDDWLRIHNTIVKTHLPLLFATCQRLEKDIALDTHKTPSRTSSAKDKFTEGPPHVNLSFPVLRVKPLDSCLSVRTYIIRSFLLHTSHSYCYFYSHFLFFSLFSLCSFRPTSHSHAFFISSLTLFTIPRWWEGLRMCAKCDGMWPTILEGLQKV